MKKTGFIDGMLLQESKMYKFTIHYLYNLGLIVIV